MWRRACESLLKPPKPIARILCGSLGSTLRASWFDTRYAIISRSPELCSGGVPAADWFARFGGRDATATAGVTPSLPPLHRAVVVKLSRHYDLR